MSMAHDVFVSYSQQDKAVADAVVARLEQDGTRCWIAPRDIVPGTSWGDAIVDAITASRVMILILSMDSSRSRQVIREVERAVSSDVVVLPFRIEDVDPTGAMAYFLGTEHWLDALTPPMERHIERLSRSVSSLLSTERTIEPVVAGPGSGGPPDDIPPPPRSAWWQRIPRPALFGGGTLVAAVIVFVGISLSGGGTSVAVDTSTTTSVDITTTTDLPTTTEATTTTSTTSTTTPPTTIPTEYVYIYELQVGDCFDDRGTPLIPIVPCESPHDREVFAIFDYPEGPYPESSDTSALCIAEFEPYVGISFQESEFGLHKMVPSEDAWDNGERTFYCALQSLDDSQLVGSAQGTAR